MGAAKPALAIAAPPGFNDHPLDQTFEDMLRAFRAVLDVMLAREPAGPAQTVRAFVHAAYASAVHLPSAQKAKLRQLLQEPQYQEIWTEYFDEACMCDAVEENIKATCRRTLLALWQDFILRGEGQLTHFLRTRDILLTLTSAQHATRHPPHHEPHCTG